MRKFSQADLLTIAANLLPVYGVWFLGWSGVDVFTVYALETLIIGILTVLKMFIATLYRGKDDWYNNDQKTRVSGFFFILFFIVHFGMFAAIQTAIFSQTAGITPPNSGMLHFFFHWWTYITEDIAIMLGGFVVSYVAQSLLPFIVKGEYKTVPMMRLMFQPYGRIFIQQITVILGSMLLTFGWAKGFVLIFALAKIYFDVYINFDKILDQSMDTMKKSAEK